MAHILRRKGSVIIMAVGLLVMLAMIGTTFIVLSHLDRKEARSMASAVPGRSVAMGVLRQMLVDRAADLHIDPTGLYPGVYGNVVANAANPNFNYYSMIDVPSELSTDRILASTTPIHAIISSPAGPAAGPVVDVWKHLTNLYGNPASTGYIDVGIGDERLVDADGSAAWVADPGVWVQNDAVLEDSGVVDRMGRRVFVAARLIDASGLLNVNVALAPAPTQVGRTINPTDLSLAGMLQNLLGQLNGTANDVRNAARAGQAARWLHRHRCGRYDYNDDPWTYFNAYCTRPYNPDIVAMGHITRPFLMGDMVSLAWGGQPAPGSGRLYSLLGDNGQATGGTATTLTDAKKRWIANWWGAMSPGPGNPVLWPAFVEILGGAGADQIGEITGNTSNTLNILWRKGGMQAPDSTSTYRIYFSGYINGNPADPGAIGLYDLLKANATTWSASHIWQPRRDLLSQPQPLRYRADLNAGTFEELYQALYNMLPGGQPIYNTLDHGPLAAQLAINIVDFRSPSDQPTAKMVGTTGTFVVGIKRQPFFVEATYRRRLDTLGTPPADPVFTSWYGLELYNPYATPIPLDRWRVWLGGTSGVMLALDSLDTNGNPVREIKPNSRIVITNDPDPSIKVQVYNSGPGEENRKIAWSALNLGQPQSISLWRPVWSDTAGAPDYVCVDAFNHIGFDPDPPEDSHDVRYTGTTTLVVDETTGGVIGYARRCDDRAKAVYSYPQYAVGRQVWSATTPFTYSPTDTTSNLGKANPAPNAPPVTGVYPCPLYVRGGSAEVGNWNGAPVTQTRPWGAGQWTNARLETFDSATGAIQGAAVITNNTASGLTLGAAGGNIGQGNRYRIYFPSSFASVGELTKILACGPDPTGNTPLTERLVARMTLPYGWHVDMEKDWPIPPGAPAWGSYRIPEVPIGCLATDFLTVNSPMADGVDNNDDSLLAERLSVSALAFPSGVDPMTTIATNGTPWNTTNILGWGISRSDQFRRIVNVAGNMLRVWPPWNTPPQVGWQYSIFRCDTVADPARPEDTAHGQININTATEEVLRALPVFAAMPALSRDRIVREIIAYRDMLDNRLDGGRNWTYDPTRGRTDWLPPMVDNLRSVAPVRVGVPNAGAVGFATVGEVAIPIASRTAQADINLAGTNGILRLPDIRMVQTSGLPMSEGSIYNSCFVNHPTTGVEIINYARSNLSVAENLFLPPGFSVAANGPGQASIVDDGYDALAGVPGFDVPKRHAYYSAISNLLTVRSDVYLAYIAVFSSPPDGAGTVGVVSGNTFTDASKSWTLDQWRRPAGQEVRVAIATATGIQYHKITPKADNIANTANTLTLSATPSSGSYQILSVVRRYMAMIDRSNCRSPTDLPVVLFFAEVK